MAVAPGAAAGPADVRALLAESDEFTVFANAMDQSGVLDEPAGNARLIVFAPTDRAMEAEGSAFLLDGVMLDAPNAERLRDLMALHVAVSPESLEGLAGRLDLYTLEGSCMPVARVADQLRIGPEANVVERRVAADGWLYVIDRLLWRPYRGAHPCGPGASRRSQSDVARPGD